MQTQASVFLAEGIVIGCALILVAALVLVFSPMLWTDHLLKLGPIVPVPAGCTLQTSQYVITAHCPIWVNWPY